MSAAARAEGSPPPTSHGAGPGSPPQRLGLWAASHLISGQVDRPGADEVDLLGKGGQEAVLEAVRCPPQLYDGDVQAKAVLLDTSRIALRGVRLERCSVLLHIYDLSADLQKANELLAFSLYLVAVGGAFHVGVESFGSEWSYGALGVLNAPPRSAGGHVYHCSLHLGRTSLTEDGFAELLHQMCQEWRGADYQVLGHNCCSFASDLCDRLGVGPMPPWVNRIARLLHLGQEAGREVLSAGQRASKAFRQSALAASQMLVQEALTHKAMEVSAAIASGEVATAFAAMYRKLVEAAVPREPMRRRSRRTYKDEEVTEDAREIRFPEARERLPGITKPIFLMPMQPVRHMLRPLPEGRITSIRTVTLQPAQPQAPPQPPPPPTSPLMRQRQRRPSVVLGSGGVAAPAPVPAAPAAQVVVLQPQQCMNPSVPKPEGFPADTAAARPRMSRLSSASKLSPPVQYVWHPLA